MVADDNIDGVAGGWGGRATARDEAKGKEEEHDVDANTLHLRRCRSAVALAPTRMRVAKGSLDICIGINADASANAGVECRHLCHPLPPLLLPHLSSSLSLLIYICHPRPLVASPSVIIKNDYDVKIILLHIVFMLSSINLTALG